MTRALSHMASAVAGHIETPIGAAMSNSDIAALALNSAFWCSDEDADAGYGAWPADELFPAVRDAYLHLITVRNNLAKQPTKEQS